MREGVVVAIFLLYELVTESDLEVMYRFGPTERDLSGRVGIDPVSCRTIEPVDSLGVAASKVAGRVINRFRREGTWPVRGAIQS